MPLFEPIPSHVERVAKETIGAALHVHRVLGPGFLERIYQQALCIELQLQGIAFERERPVIVFYRDVAIPGQRIDLIVEKCLVVELKAAPRFATTSRSVGPVDLAEAATRPIDRSLCVFVISRILFTFVVKPSPCPS